jgi:hypothetical protein
MTSTCYPSCPVPGYAHIVTHAPHVPVSAHLAFTGFNANEGILVGAIAVIGGLLFLVADRMLRRK